MLDDYYLNPKATFYVWANSKKCIGGFSFWEAKRVAMDYCLKTKQAVYISTNPRRYDAYTPNGKDMASVEFVTRMACSEYSGLYTGFYFYLKSRNDDWGIDFAMDSDRGKLYRVLGAYGVW